MQLLSGFRIKRIDERSPLSVGITPYFCAVPSKTLLIVKLKGRQCKFCQLLIDLIVIVKGNANKFYSLILVRSDKTDKLKLRYLSSQ